MQRVVVLGRGGAGKSAAAEQLGALLRLPVLELDSYFWGPELTPMPTQKWTDIQRQLAAGQRWIMDGDLGPHDTLGPRLAAADTVLLLDFSLVRCAWQAARRAPERWDFWSWVVLWRWRSRPAPHGRNLQACSAGKRAHSAQPSRVESVLHRSCGAWFADSAVLTRSYVSRASGRSRR